MDVGPFFFTQPNQRTPMKPIDGPNPCPSLRRRVDRWSRLSARRRRRQRSDEAVRVAGQVGVAPGPAARSAGALAHVRTPTRLLLQQRVDVRCPRERTSPAAHGTLGPREAAARQPGTAPQAVAALAAAVSVVAVHRLLQQLEAASTAHRPPPPCTCSLTASARH